MPQLQCTTNNDEACSVGCASCQYDRAQLAVQPCGCALHGGCVKSYPIVLCPACNEPAAGVSFLQAQTKLDSAPSRCGRWTIEEERFAEAIIDEFMAGRLNLRNESKLGSVLQSLLCRTSAGINRKFPGAKTLMYTRNPADIEKESPEQHLLRQRKLQNLEGIYIIAQNCSSEAQASASLPAILQQQWQRLLAEFLPEVHQTVLSKGGGGANSCTAGASWDRRCESPTSAMHLCRGDDHHSGKKISSGSSAAESSSMAVELPPVATAVPLPNSSEAHWHGHVTATLPVSKPRFPQARSNSASLVRPCSPPAAAVPATVAASPSHSQQQQQQQPREGGALKRSRRSMSDTGAVSAGLWGTDSGAPHLDSPTSQAMRQVRTSLNISESPPPALLASPTGSCCSSTSLTATSRAIAPPMCGARSSAFRQQVITRRDSGTAHAAASGGSSASGSASNAALTSAQRTAFDDVIFDQLAGLIYSHKALSVLNPCFREESVLPLLLQLMSGCTEESAMWLIDLGDDARICAVTDGIAALELTPSDLEKQPLHSVRALAAMCHPNDSAQRDSIIRRCQQDLRRVMETNPLASFHDNKQSWLNNSTVTRFRCNPLFGGWAESAEAGAAPESGFDSLKASRVFASDRFLLIRDCVRMRGASSRAPFGPPQHSFYSAPAEAPLSIRSPASSLFCGARSAMSLSSASPTTSGVHGGAHYFPLAPGGQHTAGSAALAAAVGEITARPGSALSGSGGELHLSRSGSADCLPPLQLQLTLPRRVSIHSSSDTAPVAAEGGPLARMWSTAERRNSASAGSGTSSPVLVSAAAAAAGSGTGDVNSMHSLLAFQSQQAAAAAQHKQAQQLHEQRLRSLSANAMEGGSSSQQQPLLSVQQAEQLAHHQQRQAQAQLQAQQHQQLQEQLQRQQAAASDLASPLNTEDDAMLKWLDVFMPTEDDLDVDSSPSLELLQHSAAFGSTSSSSWELVRTAAATVSSSSSTVAHSHTPVPVTCGMDTGSAFPVTNCSSGTSALGPPSLWAMDLDDLSLQRFL